jgi:Cu-processing system ATP-binding protein
MNPLTLEVEDLHKAYGRKQVLRGLGLDARPGSVIAILGANGSGKSTFMRCLLGLHVFAQGRIAVMGEDVRKGPSYRRHIGYMPQTPSFPENLTVREIANLVARVRKAEPDFARGREMGVQGFLDEKWKTLSGGMKQKVNAMLAVAFDAPLLVLDEPTASLDPASRLRLVDLLKRERAAGKTILLSTHLLGDLWELADRLAFLKDGRMRCFPALEIPGKGRDLGEFERNVAALLEDGHRMRHEEVIG